MGHLTLTLRPGHALTSAEINFRKQLPKYIFFFLKKNKKPFRLQIKNESFFCYVVAVCRKKGERKQ